MIQVTKKAMTAITVTIIVKYYNLLLNAKLNNQHSIVTNKNLQQYFADKMWSHELLFNEWFFFFFFPLKCGGSHTRLCVWQLRILIVEF